jgi:hypothetical protein
MFFEHISSFSAVTEVKHGKLEEVFTLLWRNVFKLAKACNGLNITKAMVIG